MHCPNPRFGSNFIDANVLDGQLDRPIIAEMWRLYMEDEFNLSLPHSVKREISHIHTPPRVKALAEMQLFTLPVEWTKDEVIRLREVERLIQGNARPGQHHKDALHIFESSRYGYYFITHDRRLLKKAVEIQELLGGLLVVTPSAFLRAYYETPPRRGV